MNKFLTICEAAEWLGVTPQTLRRWEAAGKLKPELRTQGGQRRYSEAQLRALQRAPQTPVARKTRAYARVSSSDQQADLVRQQTLLEGFCASRGWSFELIHDLGSGLNMHKKGLKRLLHLLLTHQVERLVLTHKDRLLRFGSELIFEICQALDVEIVCIAEGDPPSFEQELVQDVLEIITVFSARLYGARSHRHRILLTDIKTAIDHASHTPESLCSDLES